MGKTYIIAEAGVNHNGSLELAKKLVDFAVDAGVDAVKFQTYITENLVSRFAKKADYQKRLTDSNESQSDMLRKLELSVTMHKELIAYCNLNNIDFISTPFDLKSADLLTNTLSLPKIKISSGDLTNVILILQIARTGTPIILSTGMGTIGEVEQALGCAAFGYTNSVDQPSLQAFQRAYSSEKGQRALMDRMSLLHCTTEYPTPIEEVNLLNIDTLKAAFGLPVGLSDHTEGIFVAVAAVARGARMIEKHFTTDRNLPGPDHQASLNPHELKRMVQAIRDVEIALGSSIKSPTISEQGNLLASRKSLIANHDIKEGERFTPENLTVKRPGYGIAPIHYWKWLEKCASRDYSVDEVIQDE